MILVTLLLSSFVHQLAPSPVPNPVPSNEATRAVSIPLVCDAQKTLLVPVSVQGAPARPFVLDTGSSITVIDERAAEDLNLASAGRIASPSGQDPLVTAQITVGSVDPAGRSGRDRQRQAALAPARRHRWHSR